MLTIILILFPLALTLITLLLKREKTIRNFVLAGALTEFGIAVAAFIQFKTSCHCQLLFRADWLASMGVSLKFGMDGISLLMVSLTTFLVPVIILSSFNGPCRRPAVFYSLIFFMEMALVGVFTAFDGMMFYIFWEMALIPAYFICAVWGGADRIRITFKFFIYTFTGSLLMLVALIYLYFRTPLPHSFDLEWLYAVKLTSAEQVWIFLAFFLAFAVKIPIFPFHTWQPDTYTGSPAAGTMLLAGIMLKMGVYGMIRWMIPICHQAVQDWGVYAMILAVTGIVYASVIAIRQKDMKRLVAYSSIAHVGLISAGVISLSIHAMQGAVIQMVSHGINIVGLFIVIDLVEKRTKTRNIADLGGIALKAPKLAVVFMILLLGSIALPLTNGFVGEFLLLLGIFEYSMVFSAIAGLTIVLGAVYMLRMYQRTMLGATNEITEQVTDLTWTEMAPLVPLIVMVFWIGLFPGLFLNVALPDVLQVLNFVNWR
ncbi:MAG: NADH-quinone oxidoreductase subunit M [Bacteroidota bacterium]